MSNSTDGRRRSVETNLAKDPDYYKKLAKRGGQNSTHRPMRDPEYAREMARRSAIVRRAKRDARLQALAQEANTKTEE
jgi:general stress protein YciG